MCKRWVVVHLSLQKILSLAGYACAILFANPALSSFAVIEPMWGDRNAHIVLQLHTGIHGSAISNV